MSETKFVHARGEKSHFEKELLLTMVKHFGLIHEGSSVDLDFDHQFISAHKYDATYSYKGDYGYFPGWVHLPFSFLEQNTVFMLVIVMLKKFILHFINVPAKWIKTRRRYVLNLYKNKKYYIKIFKE